ncbi:hypothetical protein V6N13_129818 [Hibiscus sabdariffa]
MKTKIMQRIAKEAAEADKWTGPLCPKIQKKLETTIEMSARCWPTNAGGNRYQVSCGPHTQHCVNLTEHICTCRKWDLTGIPCNHAISAILMIEERPETYVDDCYKKSTQKAIYSHMVNPVKGQDQWARQTYCEPILPPTLRRPPIIPHKNRKKEADEPIIQGVRVTKKGVIMTCTKCKRTGHNVRTCKGMVGGNSNIQPSSQASSSRLHQHARTNSAHTQQAPTTTTTVPDHQDATTQQPPTRIPKMPMSTFNHFPFLTVI